MIASIDVIGGGPAGLYVARLLKLRRPDLQVAVYERAPASARTFGFGVGLTESTMGNLHAADPQTAAGVRDVSYAGHELLLKESGTTVKLHGARNLAIGRAALLDVLAAAATAVGVEIRRGVRFDPTMSRADVVIAADGVSSASRDKVADELGVTTSLGRTRFVWCGAGTAVPAAYFTSAARGDAIFVAHAYPYAAGRSTFLIEADAETWRAAGLEDFDRATPPGESDEQSVALLSELFAADLGQRPLLTNRTRWTRFTDLSLQRWSCGNLVLLGDAAHTAHYTLGSGTKLALEDAITLADAITGEASRPAAFEVYERARRLKVDRFKQLARRSQAWWDTYRLRRGWPADRLALSYMTRSGNLTLSDYAGAETGVTRRALAGLGPDVPASAAELAPWILAQPLATPVLSLPARAVGDRDLPGAPIHRVAWAEPDVWGEAADAQAGVLPDRRTPLLVTGTGGGAADQPGPIAARTDFAERLRLQGHPCVGVTLPAGAREQAATAIAAGRADFVVWA